jgi:hypothetical protein
MLVEALVFRGENRLRHDGGNILDQHEVASFLAELADQVAVAGVDAQRDLRLIVGQYLDRGQLRVGQQQHDAGKGGHR